MSPSLVLYPLIINSLSYYIPFTILQPLLVYPFDYYTPLLILAGTRLILKTGVKTLGGPDQFPAPKSPSENKKHFVILKYCRPYL